ncbi:MAG: hypothetical protein M3Z28_12805 [Candidatus Dormibacteraeota bacterium]|nr:hypothetical protein [Candidatus Dormibacteraeota bacterium]
MRVVPIQVKARASLENMQGYRYFNYLLAAKDLQRDPSGFLLFTYVPWRTPEPFQTVLGSSPTTACGWIASLSSFTT